MDAAPALSVLTAFGVEGPALRLAGGQGGSFRAGGVVLKRSQDPAEADWIAGLFSPLSGPGFRVPRPVRALGGAWLVDGWTAFEYVEAQTAGDNGGRWPETLAACRAFHAALASVPQPPFIRAATHPWAIADRLAWDELRREPLEPFRPAVARLRRFLRPSTLPLQPIHGDFTANVLFAPGELPCVIDFSPYWRPSLFAEAVVIADALSWAAAPASLATEWADQNPEAAQMLVRATLRRVYELDEHTRRGRPHHSAALSPYQRAVEVAESLA